MLWSYSDQGTCRHECKQVTIHSAAACQFRVVLRCSPTVIITIIIIWHPRIGVVWRLRLSSKTMRGTTVIDGEREHPELFPASALPCSVIDKPDQLLRSCVVNSSLLSVKILHVAFVQQRRMEEKPQQM